MALIRKGQKVKLTPKPNAMFSGEIVGIMREDFEHPNYGGSALFYIKDALGEFNANAWNIELVNELPTEPGVYLSRPAHPEGVVRLYADGRWQWLGNKYNAAPEELSGDDVLRDHMPLTRLVPEA